MRSLLARVSIDAYLVAIVGMVVLATLLPARGEAATMVATATRAGIALVFFLHGARLSREAVVAGMAHWRLHLLVLSITFVVFPLAGIGIAALPAWITPPALAAGIVYLACLPSTIQSQVGLTAIARGNVAAAVCGASASNLAGIVITPALVGLLLHSEGGVTLASLEAIVWQLLVPFLAGQLVHPFVGGWMKRYAKPLQLADRGSILLVVYNAFSGAVVAGIWSRVSLPDLVRLSLICLAMLAASLALSLWLARTRGFSVEDESAIIFGGSNKSLATGVPMAGALFPAATIGFVLLPVMLYHQFQLMACAAIAQRYAKKAPLE